MGLSLSFVDRFVAPLGPFLGLSAALFLSPLPDAFWSSDDTFPNGLRIFPSGDFSCTDRTEILSWVEAPKFSSGS